MLSLPVSYMLRPLLMEMGHSQQRALPPSFQGVKEETEPTARHPSTEGLHRVWPPLVVPCEPC